VSRIVFVLVACLLALTLLVSATGCGYSHHKGGKTNTTGGY